MWPQIVIICWLSVSFAIHLMMHGKPKNQNWSFWTAAITIALWVWILDAGGFFNVLKG